MNKLIRISLWLTLLFRAGGLLADITFETSDVFTPANGMMVSTQFLASDGVIFSLEGGGSPVLADYGNLKSAFAGPPNNSGNDNLAAGSPRSWWMVSH